MSRPKAHHYVPRFYLNRFTNADGKLWVLDKPDWRIYPSTPKNAAFVNSFCELQWLKDIGDDSCLLERQLGSVESAVAPIIDSWLVQRERGTQIPISEQDRKLVSLFLAIQMLRTLEARTLLLQFLEFITAGGTDAPPLPVTAQEQTQIHADIMWDAEIVNPVAREIHERIWIFGYNDSPTLFCTSDHPVLLKSGDNRGWVVDMQVIDTFLKKERDPSDYIVFPVSPHWVLYCYDRNHYPKMVRFDTHVSPVPFTSDMVNHENSGQIGMSTRFVYSSVNDFEFAREFAADQPWIRDPKRSRLESRSNPYARGED
ncbi:DUF4238 domain-containing protein [Cystobacter fuscus]|uniref:DUF4238 domain-containing protein n=1 Tax=Cystobacter fuscus TaxID=43 RepID=UPI0009715349|nr:DUF4238 domain-containing protein [Cystobacter fuscus]